MSAKDRPFTRLAAEICFGQGGLDRLDAGLCPMCGAQTKHTDFKNEASLAEFQINGTCQSCQDRIFGEEQ